MINLLVRDLPVILQHIVVLRAGRLHQLLHNWQDLGKLVVRDICKFLAVGFWDNEGVTARERLDVEEGEDFVGFVELVGGDVAYLC